MSKTRHRIFAIAAWTALAASANAQEIEAYVPAIALPPETMGNIPPIPTVSNSTATTPVPAATNNVEPAGYFPTRMTKPNSAPITVPTYAAPQSAPTIVSGPSLGDSGQRWRWYGYGTINGRAAAGPSVFAGNLMAPTGMAAAIDAPPLPPPGTATTATPASIGIPQPMSNAPVPPTTTNQLPVTVDGPAIPQAAPEVPPVGAPSVDLQGEPKAPIPAPPVEPWGGTPISKARLATWQPVVVRASSAR